MQPAAEASSAARTRYPVRLPRVPGVADNGGSLISNRPTHPPPQESKSTKKANKTAQESFS